MLVVVIISILAAAVLVNAINQKPTVEKAVAESDIANMATALELYSLNNGAFPTNEQGLEALIEKANTLPVPSNWNGPYTNKEAIDPWKNEYKYRCPGEHNKNKYDIWSMGPDGKDGTEDDITNWKK
jgi:general secretion pathway protein G